jgi:hypothetical protein
VLGVRSERPAAGEAWHLQFEDLQVADSEVAVLEAAAAYLDLLNTEKRLEPSKHLKLRETVEEWA